MFRFLSAKSLIRARSCNAHFRREYLPLGTFSVSHSPIVGPVLSITLVADWQCGLQGWVHRETPKTTIKRVVRTMPSQNVSPGDSTQSKFKQRLQQQPSSDFPIREKLHFSQNAFATQSAFTGPRSGAQSFPDPSFEESSSFPSFRPTGMFASTPQWPSAQPEAQQIRPGEAGGA